jgi:hypothetical protein
VKYNCVILNNEIWHLHNRLQYELEWFDKIIVIENDKTFSGHSKPFFFEKYKHFFKDYLKDIIYVKNENLPLPIKGRFVIPNSFKGNNIDLRENRWHVEHASRAFAKQVTSSILKDDDFLCFQDVDEIVSHENLSKYQNKSITQFQYHLYKFQIKEKFKMPNGSSDWLGGFGGEYGILKEFDFHDLRMFRDRNSWKVYHVIAPYHLKNIDGSIIYPEYELPSKNIFISDVGGWHLSSMYGDDHRTHTLKADCFSHAEFSKSEPIDIEESTHQAISIFAEPPIKNYPIDKDFPKFLTKAKFFSCYPSKGF